MRNTFITWERGVLRSVTTVRTETSRLVRGRAVRKINTVVDSIERVSRYTKRLLDNAGVLADLERKYVKAHIETHLPSNTITVQAVGADGYHYAWWTKLDGEKHWCKHPLF